LGFNAALRSDNLGLVLGISCSTFRIVQNPPAAEEGLDKLSVAEVTHPSVVHCHLGARVISDISFVGRKLMVLDRDNSTNIEKFFNDHNIHIFHEVI
jgi:hypothetical protein